MRSPLEFGDLPEIKQVTEEGSKLAQCSWNSLERTDVQWLVAGLKRQQCFWVTEYGVGLERFGPWLRKFETHVFPELGSLVRVSQRRVQQAYAHIQQAGADSLLCRQGCIRLS